MDAVMLATKALPNVSKIQSFTRSHFKKWQQKVHDALDVLNLVEYLIQGTLEKKVEEQNNEFNKRMEVWKKVNKVCCYTIMSTLSNELYDVYCSYKTTCEI